MLSDTLLYSVLGNRYGGYPLSTPSSRFTLATEQLSRRIAADETRISGYGKLKAAVATFQEAVQGFSTASSVSSVAATSSAGAVASVVATSGASAATYDVTVAQVARSQAVVSGAFADPDATVVGSGTLTIQLGEYASGPNTFTPGASAAVAINVTNGSLNSIASAINAAGAGVTASVVQDGSGYHLALKSDSTGAANGFSLSVTDADANDTDMAGLSRLAYDPTAADGAGKNLTETQAARDAAYTIDGIAGTSASNSITISPGLTLNLLTAGGTTISVTESATALAAAARAFVDGYNDLVGTIRSLTGAGAELAGDFVSARLLPALQNQVFESNPGSGALNDLYQLGITAGTDGTLVLDSTVLESAFAADPTNAKALLNGVSASFDALVEPYLKGGGAISSATKVANQDLRYQQSRTHGLDQMSTFFQASADRQFGAAISSGYAAAIYAGLFDALSSGSIAYPSKGYSLFA